MASVDDTLDVDVVVVEDFVIDDDFALVVALVDVEDDVFFAAFFTTILLSFIAQNYRNLCIYFVLYQKFLITSHYRFRYIRIFVYITILRSK